jgi:hypothetical protein
VARQAPALHSAEPCDFGTVAATLITLFLGLLRMLQNPLQLNSIRSVTSTTAHLHGDRARPGSQRVIAYRGTRFIGRAALSIPCGVDRFCIRHRESRTAGAVVLFSVVVLAVALAPEGGSTPVGALVALLGIVIVFAVESSAPVDHTTEPKGARVLLSRQDMVERPGRMATVPLVRGRNGKWSCELSSCRNGTALRTGRSGHGRRMNSHAHSLCMTACRARLDRSRRPAGGAFASGYAAARRSSGLGPAVRLGLFARFLAGWLVTVAVGFANTTPTTSTAFSACCCLGCG